MNITSVQKKAMITGAAVLLIGGGVFVYLDPLGLNLLGLKQAATKPVVAAPKAQSGPAKPAATAVTGNAATGITSTAVSAEARTEARPASMSAPVVAPDTTPVPAVKELPPHLKPSDSIKSVRIKPVNPPSVDLRHCLDQPTNQEIAKCAGE